MTKDELISLPRIYNQPDNKIKAIEYLESRGLPYDERFQFCHYIPNLDLRNQLIIIGKSYGGKNNIVESRGLGTGVYSKLYQSSKSIPIWNLENYTGQKNIILTESAIDSKSIEILELEDTLVISTYRASFSASQYYYLLSLFMSNNIYVAFDQDKSGIENATKLINQAYRHFKKNIFMLEILGGKDSNEVLKKKGKDNLRKQILSQIL